MMIGIICNQRGNLGIAIVVAIIGLLSGLSLSSVALRDVNSFRTQLDGVQEFHLLRSEVGRARLVASIFEAMDNPPPESVFPLRKITVNFGDHRTEYTAKTKLNTYSSFAQTGFMIRSLITAVRGTGQLVTQEMVSPMKRYGENFIQSLQTLAIFHYFSDVDRAIDDVEGNIRFYGADVVHGRVHSNSDIWIRQIGGGNNNNWPTFFGLVTTAGIIRVYPGGGTNFPEEDIFRGGLIEEYPRVVFDPSADLIRDNGLTPFPGGEGDNKIAFVTIDGGSYTSWVGDIQTGPDEEFPIYNTYPPYGPVGAEIGMNVITRIDTVWAPGPSGSVMNQSVFVPYELWISGVAGGRQTWGSAANVYLKGDLTYRNTIQGQPPDGGPDGDYPFNNTDYLGILSEKSILIQYGHKDPQDEIRFRPNTNNIYIYAALCAMGEAGQANQYEILNDAGIFTFQYHFPKGSTPRQIWQGEWWENIDLHLRIYPTSPFNPWPPGLDYPWYNPIWPEPAPIFAPGAPYGAVIPNPHGTPAAVFLRGTIFLFGSVAQRYRGYVRRSGNPDFDTNLTNPLWDVENGIYGRHTGQPSGYDKDYTFDTRFETIGPPDFPLVKFEGYESDELMDLGYSTLHWKYKSPPSNF